MVQFVVMLFVAVVLYTSLGVIFYNEEAGFSWLFYFALVSGGFLAIFSYFLKRDIRRHKEKSTASTPDP